MKFDFKLDIATGFGATSKLWKNKKLQWSELVERLATPVVTSETYKEYINAAKDEQSKIKDVGGYVGGYLRNGKRSPANVIHRQLMTLDIDFAHVNFWEDFTMQFSNAAVIHATHKHCEADPRYRLIIPLNREASPDEYVAVSRQIAGILGIDLFDNTTFETNRLMFWPSVSKDVNYYYKFQDGEFVDVDEILATYIDWKDTSLWPTADKRMREIGEASKKQEDPQNKKGIVGLFCRTYPIREAIDMFLSDSYIETATEDRYTYSKGSTAGGLMVYDNTFAYSHHGTDPCSGKLCNSFDLVRLHKFGHLDDSNANGVKAKSYIAMEELARSDQSVKTIIAKENIQNAKYDFIEALNDSDETLEESELFNVEESIEWMKDLDSDSKGNYLSTAININIILANDQRLKGVFKQNDFDNKRYVFKSLPWRRITKPEPVKNVDYSGVRNYIESIYGIAATLKIDDSLALEFEKNSFHPIKDYLGSLKWDQQSRVDMLLIEYFGTNDNLYTREAIRKHLVAAVARVFKPGCKYDSVLTLVGEQGTKKSTFIKKLGKSWFSDTFMTVQGKEALEQIQGAWLIEMAELAGLRKAEAEAVKHFISKQEDAFRPAYARVAETFLRQCIFWATTNKRDFLNDPSGNRRFNPIDVNKNKITKDVFEDLDPEIDQIWAEAVHLFKAGESLILSSEAERIAKHEQTSHSEVDERRGIIEQFLNRQLPTDWDKRDISERRIFIEDYEKNGTIERDYVCMGEIWCECLGKNKEDMTRYNTREINDILKSLEDWEYIISTKNFKIYGKQKYYQRKLF